MKSSSQRELNGRRRTFKGESRRGSNASVVFALLSVIG
jgi:hypothetical protein